MGITLVVEDTLLLRAREASQTPERAFVFARPILGQPDFRVPPGSTLGGLPVKPYVDLPRRLLPDGTPDIGCFQFELVEPGDLVVVTRGAPVLLEPGK
jgi:hypothetical protein